MLTLQDRTDMMVRLGDYLSADEPALQAIKENAFRANNWFLPAFVDLAIKNICDEFLNREKLQSWAASYSHQPDLSRSAGITNNQQPVTIGIVMAGNIPLVGFHDFLCGFMSGHSLLLKLSGRDEVLFRHIMEKLISWNPSLKEHIAAAPLLKNCNAYIATGSNNSARYFEYYFAKYPHIIRRNRTSVAILEGNETAGELENLADDIFQYFGLGCRNVTKIYVPEGYDFPPLLQAFHKYDFLTDHHKYKNNIDYNLALYLLNHIPYMSSGNLLLSENPAVFSPVGVLHYETYASAGEVTRAIPASGDIQCITGHGFLPFGSAQRPGLGDYADGIDTMAFLTATFL